MVAQLLQSDKERDSAYVYEMAFQRRALSMGGACLPRAAASRERRPRAGEPRADRGGMPPPQDQLFQSGSLMGNLVTNAFLFKFPWRLQRRAPESGDLRRGSLPVGLLES
ncbi:hypothetical protein MTO96_009838 [Rhipicephalus appendiculatus]